MPLGEKVMIDINTLVDALERADTRTEQYLNKKTHEIFYIFEDPSLPQEISKDELEFSDDYIRLPNALEINDYRIMKDFTYQQSEQNKQVLLQILVQKKPYRKFKDEVFYLGIREEYFRFRHLALVGLAEKWVSEKLNDL